MHLRHPQKSQVVNFRIFLVRKISSTPDICDCMYEQYSAILTDRFQEHHISLVWRYLGEQFSFNVKYWKTELETYLQRQPRNTSVESAFLKFGNTRINDILNQVLGRRTGHDTFNKLLAWLIKSGYY